MSRLINIISVTVGREGKERKISKPLVWQTLSHKLKAAGKWRKK
jgi:hypothetical protein